jgi:hypothetical protein
MRRNGDRNGTSAFRVDRHDSYGRVGIPNDRSHRNNCILCRKMRIRLLHVSSEFLLELMSYRCEGTHLPLQNIHDADDSGVILSCILSFSDVTRSFRSYDILTSMASGCTIRDYGRLMHFDLHLRRTFITPYSRLSQRTRRHAW